jgi:outer membrane protein assembly factor BamE (lipoprotein component of BamABCDE complex)
MATTHHTHPIAHGIGKTIKWIFLTIAGLIVVGVVISLISVGSAVNHSQQSLQQVTPNKLSMVHNGYTESQVQKIIGRPEHTQRLQDQGLGTTDYWYYGSLADRTVQLVFDNGHLTGINQY